MHIYRNLLHTVNSEVKRSIGFWRLPSAVQAQPGLLQAWLGSKLRTPICPPPILPGFTRFSRVRFLTTKCRKIGYSFCIFYVICWHFWFFRGGKYPLLPPLRTPMVTNRYFAGGLRGGRVTRHPTRIPVPADTQGVVYPSPDDFPPKLTTIPPHGQGNADTPMRGKDFPLAYFMSFSAHRPTNNEIHHVRNRSIYIQCLLLQARKPSSVI